MRCVTLDGGRSEDGWRLPSDPPCREAMGRGTVAAGDGGGAATSRHSPSVSASRCHLPIATRQGGLDRQLPIPDRNSVVQGKSVSVRVDLGGGRFIKTKQP